LCLGFSELLTKKKNGLRNAGGKKRKTAKSVACKESSPNWWKTKGVTDLGF